MTKRFALIAVALTLFMGCGSPNVRYVRKAIKLMERNGLFAEGEEWALARARALSANPASIEEAHEVLRQALAVAGGKHSFIMTSMAAEAAPAENTLPTVEMRDDSIAIVVLPPCLGTTEESQRYALSVLEALPEWLRGVVVDLRGNTGGNMYPMIAAVHRFLPDDILLRFRGRSGSMPINLHFVMQTVGIERLAPLKCPVALLTNDRTGSSGEAVLLCFRGLSGVRVFGSPTAGYASCNATYVLSDGAQMLLTTARNVARTGEVFCDDPIAPDQMSDTPLEDALIWLHGQVRGGGYS